MIQAGGEDARLHQRRKAVGQDVTSDPEVALEVIKPAHAEKGVAENEDGPTIADQFCCVRH